jgi:GntR family transcriptional regulator/MocR family aminotransferase
MSTMLPIELDRTGSVPLYRQIESTVRRAIESGRLRPGQRLPSVRALAGQLGIGRLTVATAYEQLAADGYLVGRIGFGTIVAPHPPSSATDDRSVSDQPPRTAATPSAMPGRLALAPVRLPPIQLPAARAPTSMRPRRGLGPVPRFDLRGGGAGGSGTAGGQGLTVGPVFERLLREEWRFVADSSGSAATADPAGDPLLRAAIAAHVRTTRGAVCEQDQVVVLSGAVIGIGAVARLWLGPDRLVVVEDPGDPVFRRALGVSGAEIVARPVDAGGLRPGTLPDEAAVAVVSPSVQLPTGAAMPLARRLRLLSWAAATGAIVVEDARADDLTLRGAPGVCLQGLDEDGRVIHLGAFDSLLHAGVRVGYAVVPANLVDPFVAALDAIDPGPSPVQQRALGRFLADGHLDRHLARVRRALLDRQEAAIEAIGRELGWLADVQPAAGGTRLIATIEDPAWTASAVVRLGGEVGVALDTLAASRVAIVPDRELVVDYGHHEPAQLRAAIRSLARALESGGGAIREHPPRLPNMPTAAARA